MLGGASIPMEDGPLVPRLDPARRPAAAVKLKLPFRIGEPEVLMQGRGDTVERNLAQPSMYPYEQPDTLLGECKKQKATVASGCLNERRNEKPGVDDDMRLEPVGKLIAPKEVGRKEERQSGGMTMPGIDRIEKIVSWRHDLLDT
jgi:hypothetical protein